MEHEEGRAEGSLLFSSKNQNLTPHKENRYYMFSRDVHVRAHESIVDHGTIKNYTLLGPKSCDWIDQLIPKGHQKIDLRDHSQKERQSSFLGER